MLVGAKLGDIWGRDRAFAVGLVVYATGSFITAISPNLAVLLFGWSLIEGLGAVLVVPAIAALVAQNYEGKERALAYGIVGGVAAAAIAAGPVIGGWVTTTFTWRLVFVGEVFIVAVILLTRNRMKSAPAEAEPAEPGHRRRRPFGERPRDHRAGHPPEQHLGLHRAARCPGRRRSRDCTARVLRCAVPDPRGARPPVRLRGVGTAPCPAWSRPTARLRAPRDRPPPPRRAGDPRRPAAGPARDVLRAARLPPGCARAECA